MYVREVTYTDYDGVERTEKFHFNLTKAELMDLEFSVAGGYYETVQEAQKNHDATKLYEFYRDLILRSYGEKSEDGRRFVKSKEKALEFTQTEAYSIIFMDLLTNENTITEFIASAVPNGVEAIKEMKKNQVKMEAAPETLPEVSAETKA